MTTRRPGPRGHHRLLAPLLLLPLTMAAGCAPGNAETDREAGILATAIAYPRQPDAAGFARAALSVWRGDGRLAVLEMTDLHPASSDDPAVRLVIRIHVPRHVSTGFGDEDEPAFDACYRLEYLGPSSSLAGEPDRIDCPAGKKPVTPPPAPPVPHLPAHTARTLREVLRGLAAHPTESEAAAAVRRAFPSDVFVDVAVEGDRVGAAVGVSRPGNAGGPDCVVAVRTGRRVEAGRPDPVALMPGEGGCTADTALHPVTTH